uniref:uncharacterized protein LOC120345755 n=1 Tax=Styela clava TaxID=7725 RepID=UPI001939BB0A|nr:uncharacterized protein LOC120345755 [Styela clava]
MANCEKPLARNICMGLYFFFCGVEYAVILPTINGYLISLGAEQTFLGIVLASFSFGGLVSAPLYGWVADKTGSTKACVIVGNIGEIIGNLMYFIGKNQYLVWSGRLIAGLGSGAASTLFGLISHTTTAKERTSMFAILMGLRQIGLLVGPAVNENRNYGSFQDAETTENIEGRVLIIESGWKVFIREFLREEVIITNPDMQSFNQGVRIVSVRFGQIIGPLWASSLVTTSRLPIMAAVDLGILCILTAMVLLSYKRLIPPPLITGSDSESVSLVRETDSD